MVANLQALRGIAAITILLYHLGPMLNRRFGTDFHSDIGAEGVDIFFVISGFVMVFAYAQKERSAWAFYGERVIRIAPLYWMATLALIVLFGLGFRPNGLQDYSLADIVTSFVFYPKVRLDGEKAPILSLGWTLIYEMFFYLVFGAFLWVRSTRDRVAVVSAVLLVVVAAGSLFGPDSPFALRVYTNSIVLEFVAGCWLGYWYLSQPRKLGLPVGVAFVAAGLAVLSIEYYLQVSSSEYRIVTYGFPAVLVVTGALVAERSGATTCNSIVLLVGAASYSMYLFHPMLLQPFVNLAAKIMAPEPRMAIVVMPLAAVTAVVVTVGIHLGLEVPLTRWLRNLWDRERTARIPEGSVIS